MLGELKLKLISAFEPIAFEASVDIVDVKLGMNGRTVAIQVFADKEHGGITMGECSLLNKKFVNLIGEQRLFDSDYTIEVSSPGLDWPLKTLKDFNRVLNRKVRFHLSEHIEGKIEHWGVVESIDPIEQQVKVQTKEKAIYISFSKIHKAVQLIE